MMMIYEYDLKKRINALVDEFSPFKRRVLISKHIDAFFAQVDFKKVIILYNKSTWQLLLIKRVMGGLLVARQQRETLIWKWQLFSYGSSLCRHTYTYNVCMRVCVCVCACVSVW